MRHWILNLFLLCAVAAGCQAAPPNWEDWPCQFDSDCVDTERLVCNGATQTCRPRLTHGQGICKSSHDCAASHVCESQRELCLLPDKPGDLPDGSACGTDTDCRQPTGCHPEPETGTLRCGAPNGVLALCRTGADCVKPLRCEESICRSPLGTSCTSAASCPVGATCRPAGSNGTLLTCQPKAPPGAACSALQDCERGQCSLAMARCPGEAGLSCVSEADCLSPNVCSPVGTGRICTPPVSACSRCDSDSDCASGICRGSMCLSVLSGPCASDSCCPSGSACIPDGVGALKCQALGTTPGSSCLLDAHCGSSLECFENRQCRYKIGKGPCTAHSDCAGTPPVCMLGVCIRPGPVGAPCVEPDGTEVAQACQAGLLCGVTSCVAVGSLPEGARCRRDLECSSFLACIGGYCKR